MQGKTKAQPGVRSLVGRCDRPLLGGVRLHSSSAQVVRGTGRTGSKGSSWVEV